MGTIQSPKDARLDAEQQKQLQHKQRRFSLLLLLCGLIFGPLFLPVSPVRQQLIGYGDVLFPGLFSSPSLSPTCGRPNDVFAQLFQGSGLHYTLPTTEQLMQLPAALPQDQSWSQNDATYDPTTDTLCAGGWSALYVRFVNPQPNTPGSTNYNPNSTAAGWLTD
jgi:hypothetical protein